MKRRIDALKERFKDVPEPNFASPLIKMFKSITTEDEKNQQNPVPAKTTPSTHTSPITQGGLDAQLPEDIKGRINNGYNITSSRLRDFQKEEKKYDVLKNYNWLWLKKYNETIPKDVKSIFARCKTFRELQTEVNKQKKD